MAVAGLAVLAVGCVHGAGYTPVGSGQITSGGHVASAAPGSGAAAPTVAVPGDLPEADLRIDYEVWLPRAMEVSWRVHCADVVVEGEAGETFEAYRTRRLAELVAERDKARRNAAQVGAIVGNALLGQQAAVVSTNGPGASAQAGVAVDGAAAGAAAGAAMVATDVALAPDDVGQGYRRGHVELARVPAGTCSMEVAPLVRARDDGSEVAIAIDPALLVGTFQVARRDDPGKRRAIVATRGAIELRGAMRTSLVASGADADAEAAHARNVARAEAAAAARQAELEARLAVEARARAEAEARARVELDARLEIDARARVEAEARAEAEVRLRFEAEQRARVRLHGVAMTRTRVIEYLGTCGGDVHHRERLEAEAHARAELELELRARRQQIAFELRGRLHASLIAHGADPALRARLLEDAVRAANARAARQVELDAEAMQRSRIAAAEAARRAEMAAAEAARRTEMAARRAAQIAEVRGRVSATLIANGAVLRPPMPDLPSQEPGIPPASGAVWVAGTWHWSGVRWEWSEGAWLGGPGLDVGVGITIGGGSAPISSDPPAVEVPTYQAPTSTAPPPPPSREPRPMVRDHRTPAPVVVPPAQPTAPPAAPTPPASPARPKVRDHRDGH